MLNSTLNIKGLVLYGQFIKNSDFLQDPLISEDLKEIIKSNFQDGELLTIYTKPECSVMLVEGKDKITEIKLTQKNKNRFYGAYYVEELVSLWPEEVVKKLTIFKPHQNVVINYYTDFKILKISTLDDSESVYVPNIDVVA